MATATLIHDHMRGLVAIELAKPATKQEMTDWHQDMDATSAERAYQERKAARAQASSNAYNPWALDELPNY